MSAVVAFILKAISFGMSLILGNKQKAHDDLVRDDQAKTDALRGEQDAVEQLTVVNTAVDAGGVRYSDDPNNRNR